MSKIFRSMEIKGATGKVHDDGRKIYKARATSDALDRYGDVVLPGGVDLKNFMNNPVLLGIHEYDEVSVGQVLTAEVLEDGIDMEFVFAADEIGKKFESRYESGDMRAFSIGFRPKKGGVVQLWSWWDDEPELKSVEVELPDGAKKTISFKGMEQVPYRIFTSWEMLELSPVSVPANPEALLKEAAEGMIRKAVEANPMTKSFAQESVRNLIEPMLAMLRKADDIAVEVPEVQIDGSIEKHHVDDIVEEDEFSAIDAQVRLAQYASDKGTGEKETINWAKYSKGFAQFDPELIDNFASYKFLHHDIFKNEDGQSDFVLSWCGLKAAMTALLGTVDGENVSDEAKAAYAHLKAHYEDLGLEAPELKVYEEEELKAIESMSLTGELESKSVSQPATDGDSADDGSADDGTVGDGKKVEGTEALQKRVDDLEKTIAAGFEKMEQFLVALNIKASTLSDTVSRKVETKKTEVGNNGEGAPVLEVGSELLDRLEKVAE